MIYTLHNLADASLSEVGGKALNLGRLAAAGERVPPCFTIPVSESRAYAEFAQLAAVFDLQLDAESLEHEIKKCYKQRAHLYRRLFELLEEGFLAVPALRQCRLAVRSSASFEDLEGMSSAGQHDTFLGVEGMEAVADAVALCWASQWSGRAVTYRKAHDNVTETACMGVIVQELIAADKSGVIFTKDPTNKDHILIEAVRGFGDALVSGMAIPEFFRLDRTSGAVIEQVPEALSDACLTRQEIDQLVRAALRIESFSGGAQDIEWVISGNILSIVQARPLSLS